MHKSDKQIKLITALKTIWHEQRLDERLELLKYYGYDYKISEKDLIKINEKIRLPRYKLRELIGGTLNLTDKHTILGWIDWTTSNRFLIQNPTSNRTVNNYIKPSNETKYFYNIEKIDEFLENQPPHTQSLIDKFVTSQHDLVQDEKMLPNGI